MGGPAHAFPFFWLIRSEISKFKARFASKFTGSHALSKPDKCQKHQAVASKFRQHRIKLGEKPTNETLELGCVGFRGKCAKPIPSGHPGRCVLQLGVWREIIFSGEDGVRTNMQERQALWWKRGVTEAGVVLVS